MTEDYEAVMRAHPHYEKNKLRWKFLLDSYLGGEDYKRGSYLTRYATESDNDYLIRQDNTPVDNHCRGCIQIYNSFLFKEKPTRELGSIENNPNLESFMRDSDLEGRSFNNFMKDASTLSSVFGHAFIMVSKPQTNARTRAEELGQSVRPYVSLISPMNVVDWNWKRTENGVSYINYMKIVEDNDDGRTSTVREWTDEEIRTYQVDFTQQMAKEETVQPNTFGRVPVVILYSQRGMQRGFGISDIEDVATAQRAIYNFNSNIEEGIRLGTHPSLVKTVGTEAIAGAGSIVMMEDNMDPGLKPYLLEPSGNSINSIHESIEQQVSAIDRMANLGSARAQQVSQLSGIAMETEFQMLSARLSDKADNLELCEENIWSLWAQYENSVFDGTIDYPNSFNVRDTERELKQLELAKNTVSDPALYTVIDTQIAQLLDVEDYEYTDPTPEFETHTMYSPDGSESVTVTTQAQHESLTAQGYTHDE